MFDGGYGLSLVLLRGLHVFWSARATRRGLRIGWRVLRVSMIVALLICAAHGAGLL